MFGTVQRDAAASDGVSIDRDGDLQVGRGTRGDGDGNCIGDFAESDGSVNENGDCRGIAGSIGVCWEVRADSLSTAEGEEGLARCLWD